MKIREICNRSRRTETHSGALTNLEIEALATWLVENLFDEFYKKLVIASPSVTDEFDRRRRRRRKRPLAAGPGGIRSPPPGALPPAPAPAPARGVCAPPSARRRAPGGSPT